MLGASCRKEFSMTDEKPVPESLDEPKFSQLSDDELDQVAGGTAGTGTYDREATNGGTDSILVHTDNVDAT